MSDENQAAFRVLKEIIKDKDNRIAELEDALDRCREPVAYASDRAHENNALYLSMEYAHLCEVIRDALSEGGADE